jgi:hypothetical protein
VEAGPLMGIEAMFEVSAQPFLTQQSEVTMLVSGERCFVQDVLIVDPLRQ